MNLGKVIELYIILYFKIIFCNN